MCHSVCLFLHVFVYVCAFLFVCRWVGVPVFVCLYTYVLCVCHWGFVCGGVCWRMVFYLDLFFLLGEWGGGWGVGEEHRWI